MDLVYHRYYLCFAPLRSSKFSACFSLFEVGSLFSVIQL